MLLSFSSGRGRLGRAGELKSPATAAIAHPITGPSTRLIDELRRDVPLTSDQITPLNSYRPMARKLEAAKAQVSSVWDVMRKMSLSLCRDEEKQSFNGKCVRAEHAPIWT